MDQHRTPGSLLRQAREQAYLTQPALAERCGLSVSTLSKYETDTRTPTWHQLERVLAALRLEPVVAARPLEHDLQTYVERELAADPLDWWVDMLFDAYPLQCLFVGSELVADGAFVARLHGIPAPIGPEVTAWLHRDDAALRDLAVRAARTSRDVWAGADDDHLRVRLGDRELVITLVDQPVLSVIAELPRDQPDQPDRVKVVRVADLQLDERGRQVLDVTLRHWQ